MDKPKKYPKNAKRVYKGYNFDIWTWPQKMFDGSTKTFERAVQMGGVSILAAVKNKIILLKQQQPGTPWYYGLPGGAIDNPKETPRQAATRELLEETGYKPGTMKLWNFVGNRGRLWHERYTFIAQNCEKVAKQSVDPGERIKVQLISFEQLLKISEHPQFFKGDTYVELLRARADKKYAKSLKQAVFDKKPLKPKK